MFCYRLDVTEKMGLENRCFLEIVFKLLRKVLHINTKTLTLFFRYSAVSLKRKFSLQQKKQNSSITEGYRDAVLVYLFGSCPNTFLSARGVHSENSEGGLEPEVSAPTGCLTITQAMTVSRLVPGLSSWMEDEKREERLSCLTHLTGLPRGRLIEELVSRCSSASEGCCEMTTTLIES